MQYTKKRCYIDKTRKQIQMPMRFIAHHQSNSCLSLTFYLHSAYLSPPDQPICIFGRYSVFFFLNYSRLHSQRYEYCIYGYYVFFDCAFVERTLTIHIRQSIHIQIQCIVSELRDAVQNLYLYNSMQQTKYLNYPNPPPFSIYVQEWMDFGESNT